MKRYLVALILLLGGYLSATTVTGTIQDTNGNRYSNGTVSAFSVITGASMTPAATDANGSFSITLSPSTYTFTVCAKPVNIGPNGGTSVTQVCAQPPTPIIISGGSQDVSAQINAVAPILGPSVAALLGANNAFTGANTHAGLETFNGLVALNNILTGAGSAAIAGTFGGSPLMTGSWTFGLTGATNIASLNQVLYVGSCTGCYAHISTAIAALGGGTPNIGTIVVMDNYTDAITTTLQIGWLPTQVSFPTGIAVIMNPGSAVQVGVTNATAGVIVADGSGLFCAAPGFTGDENGHTSTCQVYTKDNNTIISCLICSQSNATPAINTFQDTMTVQGITAICNAGTWNTCLDVGAVGAPSSFASNTIFAGGGTGSCLLKLHNGTGGGLVLFDDELRGGGISGVTPLCINGGEATGFQGATGEILFDGGEISCMGSTSPAIAINGDAGGVHQIGVEQIWFRGIHSQTGGGCVNSTTSPYVTIVNASFIHFFETQLSISGTYVFQLSETAAFKTNALILDNVDIGCGNSTCAGESLINDTVMGVVHPIPGNVKSVPNGGFLAYVMHDEAGHMGDSTYGASVYTLLSTGCLNWGSSVFLGKGGQTGEVDAGSTCGGTNGQFTADKFVNQNDRFRGDTNGVHISNNVAYCISSTTAASGALDTCMSRVSAGVLGIGSSTPGDISGTVQAASYLGPSSTVLSGNWSCTNVTPVTLPGTSTTADQNLMACTIPAGTLNRVGRTLRVKVKGVYSTPAASTSQVTLKLKLCTVSGCGSGTVISPISIQSTAIGTVQITNDNFSLRSEVTMQTAGASSAYEASGEFLIDLSTLTTAADSEFGDTNTATVGTIDSTGQLFLQTTIAFSVASASNVATQRQLIAETVN